MAYRVHRLDIDLESNPSKLEDFLNDLKGEVVSIIPNYKRTSLLQIVGAARKIDFVLKVPGSHIRSFSWTVDRELPNV